MAYAFVQQNANDNAASATTITVTLTPTTGNLLVFCVSGDSADTTSIALSDNLGSHNTFVQIGTDLVTAAAQRCAWWFAANCKGGATTFTATFSASTRFRTIYVAEYSGIATTSPFLNGTRAESNGPGTATDAVSSGTANATSQPALVWGFGIDISGGSAPTAGTGFTPRAGVWSSATSLGIPEDKRVTTTGNVAATFTATTGADDHAAGVGLFAEAASAPTVSGWEPDFPDRIQARVSVSALGVAVAPVLAIALAPLSWSPSFPDVAPARPVPNFATGSATMPAFVPPDQPPATPLSWSPVYPDQLCRSPAALITGGSSAPEATLPNAPAPPLSWAPTFPDAIPRARAPLIAGGGVVPEAPNSVPSLASWASAYADSTQRPRALHVLSGGVAPVLPIPDPPPTIFPLTISSNGRHLRTNNGTPFLLCADTTWSLFVDIPLNGLSSYFSTLISQGFNAVSGNVIEHHYTTVKPPNERGGFLPFTKRMDGASYTGSPNGTTGAAGTQGQFASDNYSNINTQAPDCTFVNTSYWQVLDQIVSSANNNNLVVLIWPGYLGFHANDEGWLNEMVVWDAATGAGGFTGQSFADPAKSKMFNFGAFLADRWKTYSNIIWVMGGDFGSNTQTLSGPQSTAVSNLMAGLKSVAGQRSLLFSAHWDRPALSSDTSLAAGSFDLNGCYADEAVAELARRGYGTSPTKPTIGLEYYYENDLFGGSAPYRKYVYWQFLGGIAGGFFGNEQLWRFDDGTPGTDWTTLLATQARLDAVRQFAFWKARPWQRLVPNGLGGIGTLITAGGGTASPQSTDYVAAAATPERDLLLAYVPPAHTGSVTVDMTKLGATVTARWFDPANATFTNLGTFPNTGTHAFSTPGNNSAGDADWLLVLEAPDASMPLSWDPVFPDRAPRLSLGLAQVVSGVVEPVAPPPPPTVANWSSDFPDFAPRARQPVITGGMVKPESTLPNPVFSWTPSFPDRTAPPPTSRLPGGPVAPPTDTNAGPLTWLSAYPDRAPGRPRVTLGGESAPPTDTSEPLSWASVFPDRVPGRQRVTLGGDAAPPPDANAGPLTWSPVFPARVPTRTSGVISGGNVEPEMQPVPASASWGPVFQDRMSQVRGSPSGGSVYPEAAIVSPSTPPLSWYPSYPDSTRRARGTPIAGGAAQPEAVLPNQSAPALSWRPAFPDLTWRTRGVVIDGGHAAPVATLPNPPPPFLAWAPRYPDTVTRMRASPIVGGAAQPEASLPNLPPTIDGWLPWYPPYQLRHRARAALSDGQAAIPILAIEAHPMSWRPTHPDRAPSAPPALIVGGASAPDAVLPNPPAPLMSWAPSYPDVVVRERWAPIGNQSGVVAVQVTRVVIDSADVVDGSLTTDVNAPRFAIPRGKGPSIAVPDLSGGSDVVVIGTIEDG